MPQDDLRIGRKAALGAFGALVAAVAGSATSSAGQIPTIGGRPKSPGFTNSASTPTDVVTTLHDVIDGINGISGTSDVVATNQNPRFCKWDDIEYTLRQVADQIHERAEKSDTWRWHKHHRACVAAVKNSV